MEMCTNTFRAMSLPPRYNGIGLRSCVPLGGRAIAIAVLVFSAVALWAQAPVPDAPDTKLGDGARQQAGTPSAAPAQTESQSGKGSGEEKPSGTSEDTSTSKSKDESEGKQTNRIMGVVPNFGAVSANTQLPPL